MRASCHPYLVLGLLVACGGSDKKDVDEPDGPSRVSAERDGEAAHAARAPNIDDGPDDGLEVEGLKGKLDPADVERGVRPHAGALEACFQERSKQQKFLGGTIEMAFLVDRQGQVKSVQIAKGDLGAWEVESCLLAEARSMTFPKPTGGDAEFSLPLDFPPRRSPIWWSEEQADTEVAERLAELDECAPAPSNVWVTLYVGVRGEVQTSGFASPSEAPIDDEWARCAAEKIGTWTLTDPRGKIAKVGFRYRPE